MFQRSFKGGKCLQLGNVFHGWISGPWTQSFRKKFLQETAFICTAKFTNVKFNAIVNLKYLQ